LNSTDIVGDLCDATFCQSIVTPNTTAILHTAALHKPHVATHTRQAFVDTNITATLHLLEAALQVHQKNQPDDDDDDSTTTKTKFQAFVLTSTTSTFGNALKPEKEGDPAVWIDETVRPQPKNIYGVTKTAAEDLCTLFVQLYQLPCVVLKTSRFFPEEDDTEALRNFGDTHNVQLNELLFRRADLYDMCTAHIQAISKAQLFTNKLEKFIISGTCPFTLDDTTLLGMDAPAVLAKYYPQAADIMGHYNWKFFPSIDRVYRNDKARQLLDWTPKYTFDYALEQLLEASQSTTTTTTLSSSSTTTNTSKSPPLFGSELARQVGIKGYHYSD
jgi:nucleoside-diphosphate-sugar epimerase